MANFDISVDTDNRKISVQIDGKKVADIDDVSIYTYRDEKGEARNLEISLVARSKQDNGVMVRTSYYAAGSEEASYATAALGKDVITDIDGFIGVSEDQKVKVDVLKYITKRRKN
jgi:hypothetical protein